MIPSVHKRGTRLGGLVRYLFGPGRREEHVNPRVVAAWDGAPDLAALQPTVGETGRHDVSRLVELLEQPVAAAYRPPERTVWHCSVRNHATDRVLTDVQWGHIAGEIMAQAGLAAHGDRRAVRWVAMRHGEDHIHIVATLVRQDRRTEWARRDRWRTQAAARDLEERYGLYRVGPTDRTAPRNSHRVEVNKASRKRQAEAPRDRLRRQVRFAAAATSSTVEFFDELRDAGVLVRLRHSDIDPTQVTGYAVALPDFTTAAGDPVFYSGGRLAADLTLPKLRSRWGEHQARPTAAVPAADRPTRAHAYEQAAEQVRQATEEIRRLAGNDPAAATSAAYAAADVLTVTARMLEGDQPGPLTRAADAVDRAAREPFGRVPPRTARAEGLRSMSRLLALMGRLGDDKATFIALRMILDLSRLAESLGELREAQDRLHQARAARSGAQLLREIGERAAGRLTPPLTPHRDSRRQGPRPQPGPRL